MSTPLWPRATTGTTPLRATVKARHEDFVVEEVPAYEPCGQGDHIYIRIEKRGLSTARAVRDLARALGVRPRNVGVAGMKDARGVSRQTVSIERCDPARIEALSLPRIRINGVERHRNKLRTGHLRGNRFAIKLRDTEPARERELCETLRDLCASGVPNYFGPQRFGARGDTWEIGRAMVRGEHERAARLICGAPGADDEGVVREARVLYDAGRLAESARTWPRGYDDCARLCESLARRPGDYTGSLARLDRKLLALYASAYQSYLFNEVVAARIDALGALTEGDLAWKHDNGAVFRVEDPQAEQPRADRFEISPTGPMYGSKMTRPGGRAAEIEAAVLDREGLAADGLPRSGPLKCIGGRRPLRLRAEDASAEAGADEHGPFVELRFFLPAGGYATTLLREICGDELRGA